MILRTRREALTGAGALAGLLAGCLGTTSTVPGSRDDRTTARASFFVVYDFAAHVAGGAAAVDSLVPLGQHGHGWQPGPGIHRDVLGADALVYVGEGFQPWVDRVVRNVRADGGDVALIEAWAGVDLLERPRGGRDREDGHDDHDDHDEHGGDGVGSGDEHEDGHEGHDEGRDEDDDHGHGTKDPHFWLDPLRSVRSVRTIADGLTDLDRENADAYAEAAESYVGRLRALDEAYRARLADRTRGTVLVAGHDSFRYLGRRYGFDVEALVDLSPDAEPSPRDVAHAQSVIDDHDIEYVLAPVFESDRAARQLVEETDAKGVLPLTPVPALTREWHEAGWGYLEVMERVNLPSLERALGAR